MNIGGWSWPFTSRPGSSQIERLTGPSARVMPLLRSHCSAVLTSALAVFSSSASNRPQKPVPGPKPCSGGCSSARKSICAEMRPTVLPSRSAMKSCASAWLNQPFFLGSIMPTTSLRSGGTQLGSPALIRYATSMNFLRSALVVTGRMERDMGMARLSEPGREVPPRAYPVKLFLRGIADVGPLEMPPSSHYLHARTRHAELDCH